MTPPDRNAFAAALAQAIDDALAIDPAGRVDRARLEALAMDTFDWAVARGLDPGAQIVFENDFDWCVEIAKRHPASTPPELFERWLTWSATYPSFAADHPKLEMLSIMTGLSERIFGASWMTTDESILLDWADQPSHLPPPRFVAPGGYIEAAIHRRLQALRRRTCGWLQMNNGKIVFVTNAEWRRQRRDAKAAAKRHDDERQAHAAWRAARERRVGEAVSAARANPRVWEELKAWERSQGSSPWPLVGATTPLPRPDAAPSDAYILTALDPADIEARDAAVTLAPEFDRLFDSLRRPGEVFPTVDAVMRIRVDLRTELGLNPLAFRVRGKPTRGRSGQ